MKTKNMILIRLSLRKYGTGDNPHPRDIKSPANVIGRWWIPKTMSDSIWIFYEFKDFESKKEFLLTPDAVFDSATITDEDNKFINKWVRG